MTRHTDDDNAPVKPSDPPEVFQQRPVLLSYDELGTLVAALMTAASSADDLGLEDVTRNRMKLIARLQRIRQDWDGDQSLLDDPEAQRECDCWMDERVNRR